MPLSNQNSRPLIVSTPIINGGVSRIQSIRNRRRRRIITNEIHQRRTRLEIQNQLSNLPRQIITNNLLINQFFNGISF
jgi:hypothetical protein